MTKDYYAILGAQKDDSTDTIKRKFRKLAMEYHPDRNQGNKEAEHKFKEINEAYEILKDGQKRAAYDRHGSAAFEGHASSGGGFHDFADIFGSIFGDMSAGTRQRAQKGAKDQGANLSYDLTITLEEAYNGVSKSIRYSTATKCDDCDGTGSKGGKLASTTCTRCGGSGMMRSQQGFFVVEQTCGFCRGAGKVIKDPCSSCKGQGRVEKQRSVSITVPKGVNNKDRIRIKGEGEAGLMGGESGDLYVIIHLSPHHIYKREGDNLRCSIPVKMVDATLGSAVEILGIDGHFIKITIPSGIQNGTELRLKGKGMPMGGRGHVFGDLLVQINVEIPVQLTQKQQELLQQFDKESHEKSHPQSDGFFAKMKNLWSDISS